MSNTTWFQPLVAPITENTFIPTVASTGTQPTITYTTREGYYKKYQINSNVSQVFVYVNIVIASRSGGTGDVTLTGLPFTAGSTLSAYTMLGTYISTTGNHRALSAQLPAGSTILAIYDTLSPLGISSLGANEKFVFTFSYLV